MKKIIIALLFCASAQFAMGQKFAYVDTEYILDLLPDYRSAQKQLDIISESWQKEGEAKKAEIDKMYREYDAEKVLLTEEMKKKREQEIQKKESDLKEFFSKKFGYEGELFKKRQELIKPIQDKVFDAVQKIAKQSGLDFIFAKSAEMIMLYTNAKYDKSDEVLHELGINVTKNKNQQQQQQQGGSPTGAPAGSPGNNPPGK